MINKIETQYHLIEVGTTHINIKDKEYVVTSIKGSFLHYEPLDKDMFGFDVFHNDTLLAFVPYEKVDIVVYEKTGSTK